MQMAPSRAGERRPGVVRARRNGRPGAGAMACPASSTSRCMAMLPERMVAPAREAVQATPAPEGPATTGDGRTVVGEPGHPP